MLARFPYVADVEFGWTTFEKATVRSNPDAFIVKVEAACVHGEDLAPRIAGYKPGPEMAFQTRYFRDHLALFLEEYPGESEQEKPATLVWILRRFLRLGMELVMEREARFTRDLYLCYESFATHYPEKQDEMYRALQLAVDPDIIGDAEGFVREFGGWLADEADNLLERWRHTERL